ncbi:hypothetical protein K9L16_01170 [Candidatus Pacearchaeota archaeon]|nr:hypothetical protein [Candidatus Pacearchaeota archaeon]
MEYFQGKRGQVTIFIIIGIVIVLGAGLYLVFRDSEISRTDLPETLEPVYNNFLSCLEENTESGINLLESQAGYIYLPEFESGSAYSPFSSQLNLFGNPVPYWYYVSGNNIPKQQVPTKSQMEEQLAEYIGENLENCIFDNFYEQDFEIITQSENARTDVDIRDDEVRVSLDMNFAVRNSEASAVIDKHNLIVNSRLGEFYDSAKKVFENEQETLFLEEYGVDTLRLYAPVDGVELTCSPLTWNANEVFDELQEAIEANTFALRNKGSSYSLSEKENKYFIVDLGVKNDVRFLNSRNWSNSFEVNPSQGGSGSPLLISKPVGNQQGLGILGFCYVPYHFVYDLNYPVLVQVGDLETGEFFQFPVAVVIRGNLPREPDEQAVSFNLRGYPEICEYKNTGFEVRTYDANLNSVDAKISFECFGTTCEIGESVNGVFNSNFPQCNNGYIIAEADGFQNSRYLTSTVNSGVAEIILDKVYEQEIVLKLDNSVYSGEAIISFVSNEDSKTLIYPKQKTVELSEGQYEIQVNIYENSSIKLDESKTEQCIEIPKSGVGGFLGLSEEKCFDITIPSQIVSNALAGGGSQSYYILESELETSNILEINADKLPRPNSLEQLQENYILFEEKGLGVEFK